MDKRKKKINCCHCFTNWPLGAPQTGQVHSSGNFSKVVPGCILCSESPASGSYTYPHTLHSHLFILIHRIFDRIKQYIIKMCCKNFEFLIYGLRLLKKIKDRGNYIGFKNFSFGALQIGHLSGGEPSTVFPQTLQT